MQRAIEQPREARAAARAPSPKGPNWKAPPGLQEEHAHGGSATGLPAPFHCGLSSRMQVRLIVILPCEWVSWLSIYLCGFHLLEIVYRALYRWASQ